MSTKELKFDLVKRIMDLEDKNILKQIKNLLAPKSEITDWADELSVEQIQNIEIGKRQMLAGELFSDLEVESDIDIFLDKKRKSKSI
jgi:hypothetical protein